MEWVLSLFEFLGATDTFNEESKSEEYLRTDEAILRELSESGMQTRGIF